ncbi:exported hypothetical protein [Gammaproteobacteria bacterium]
MMNAKRSFPLVALLMAIALLLIPTAGRADLPIYTDGDLYGWTDPVTMLTKSWQEGSWGISDDFYNTSPVHSGQSSIALYYDCGWCALSLHMNPPLDPTGVQSVRFWLNGGEQGGQQDLLIRVCDNGNEPICVAQPLLPVGNQWTQVELPLDGFAGANIASIQWNNWSGNTKSPVYLDDIVLVGAHGGDGTVPLFTDSKSPNWNFWNTNTENRVVAAPTHSGNAALAVDSLLGWNTMQLGHANSVENIAGLYTLRFWINGGDAGGQKITVSASNDQGYSTLDTVVTAEANTWKKVEIPLDELGDPLTVYSIRWWNGSPNVMPTFYLDDIALVPGPGPAAQGPEDISSIYSDFLSRGWIDMFAAASGDDATAANLTSAIKVHGGSTAIEVSNLMAGRLVAFGHPTGGLDIPGYDTLRFFIHGGVAGGQQVTVEVLNEDFSATESLEVTAQAGTWTQVDIPLSTQLNPLDVYIVRIWNKTAETLQTFYLDDIGFVSSTGVTPPPSSAVGPNLSVDTASERHPISPYIYGMNNPDELLAQELHLPVNRWGGNQTSTYNWQNDTYNTGFDWYYENISSSDPASLPDGSSVNRFIEQNQRTGTASLITMPMIGWVAKRWNGYHPFDCAFKQSVYGAQKKADWEYDPDCGNGVLVDGSQVVNNPNDFAVAIGPEFVLDWIAYLTGRYGSAAAGGVSFYALDNEPMLWNSTHNEVFNHPLSTDELIDLTYAYAPAIKAADPSAKIFGPVFWGWCAYFYSAVDNCTNNGTADYQVHGSIPLVAWYLQKMHAYEQQHGVRILDYLDLHGYPNGAGVYSTALGNRPTQALRLRSTRQLWDHTYQDESWVPAAIQLIPRMRDWVAENYPGTKLAITEYNWGAMGYMNGALAQADVLGIFGREGLDLATLWDPPKKTQPGAMAFRMYLNYDGHGATFGDTGVHAESTDQEQLAIYAAEKGTKLTLMIVNKTALALTSPVALAGFRPAATAQVYRYSSAHLGGIVREADQAMTDSGFTGIFPPSSITLVIADEATEPATSALAVAKAGAGQGRVASSPNGIDCGGQCSYAFPRGGSVTLTASPSPGSVFAGWSGSCTGTGTCAITIDASQSITATFTLNSYAITASPTAGGTATCAPNPVDHGSSSTCTATPNIGYTFQEWSGDCTGTSCTLSNVTAAKAITATFTLNTYAITTAVSPTGAGTVTCTVNPVPHGGGSTCTAMPATGYTFSAWNGACPGASCVLSSVTAAKAVTATFTLNNNTLTVVKAGTGSGTVGGSGSYAYNTRVTPTATAATGSTFTGWNPASCASTFALTANTTCTATFTLKSYAITPTVSPTGAGTVTCTVNPVPHGGGSTCTATPATGYTFSAWSGACTGASCVLSSVTAAKAVTATFTLNNNTLTVVKAGTGSGTVGGSGSYAYNTRVTPTATAATGSTFTGWNPASCASTFALTANTTCTATFTLKSYAITTTASPLAGGTVTCTRNPVPHGSSSTCTAVPNTGYTFSAFSGACTGASCTLTNVTAAKAVTASFIARPDFVVTGVVLTPASPSANRTFSAAVTVKNQGAAAGVPRTLQVWVNQPAVLPCWAAGNKSAVLSGRLGAGASIIVPVAGLPAGVVGAKTLRVFIDSTCLSAESNEANNQMAQGYIVK